MHPKKKLAHMTQVNNFPVVNNLIHSTLPFLSPIPVTNNHQTNVNNKLSSLPPSLSPVNHGKKVTEHNNILVTRNGIDHHDDYEFKDEEANNKIMNLQKAPPPVKPKKSNNENSGKKGRDVRTKCDVCLGDGTNANLVR